MYMPETAHSLFLMHKTLVALATSAVMGLSLFKTKLCTTFLCLVHYLTLHCLIKVYQMTVKLRTVYTCLLYTSDAADEL